MEEIEQPAPLPTHAGPLPASDDDFFVPLPAEIGEPLSVQTNWKKGETMTPFRNAMLTSFLCFLGVLLLIWALWLLFYKTLAITLSIFVGGFGLIFIAILVLRPKRPTCTYVGTEGWSRHAVDLIDTTKVATEIFRFEDASSLRAEETQISMNYSHISNNYRYLWRDAQGKTLTKLTGTYSVKKGNPKFDHEIWFVKAVEAAWSDHWLARHRAEFERDGFYSFPISSRKTVRVGNGFLEFDWKGQIHRAHPEDIAKITFANFNLKILFHDMTILGRGRFFVDMENLPNFHAFTTALEQIAGIPFPPMALRAEAE